MASRLHSAVRRLLGSDPVRSLLPAAACSVWLPLCDGGSRHPADRGLHRPHPRRDVLLLTRIARAKDRAASFTRGGSFFRLKTRRRSFVLLHQARACAHASTLTAIMTSPLPHRLSYC